MRPLVSILIPTYNASRWVGRTLESCLGQSWPRVEIIVVDDGSTDGTLDVLRRNATASVRVVAAAHAGASVQRNRALAESQGELVQFLDADDVLAPDKIERQVRRLSETERDAVSTSAWARFYGDDPTAARFRTHADFRDFAPGIEWLLQAWNGAGTMPPLAWLMPRGVVEAAGNWDESLTLNDDLEYFTRISLRSSRIAFCPEARAYYRSGHPTTLSSRRDPAAVRSYHDVCRLAVQHLLAHEDSARTRRASAALWQSFVYRMYPDAPAALLDSAEEQVEALGGSDLRLNGSRTFRALEAVVGWKAAKRTTLAYRRLRHPLA